MTEPARPPDQQLDLKRAMNVLRNEGWVPELLAVEALSRRVEALEAENKRLSQNLEACGKLSRDRQQLFQAAERRVEELEARTIKLEGLALEADAEAVAAEREANRLRDDLEAVKRMYPRVRDFLDARASVSARPKEDSDGT